jgi:hypothetical protein
MFGWMIISEADIEQISNLAEVLQRESIDAAIDDDGDLVATVEGTKVVVHVSEDVKLLAYMAFFSFTNAISLERKYEFVNRLNNEYMLARFSIGKQDPTLLLAEYYFPYEGGLTPVQIVTSMRHFAEATQYTLEVCDVDDWVG